MEILVVCKHEQIAHTIARLIHKKENWRATVALACNDAISLCSSQTFNIILIGSGVTQQEEDEIVNRLKIDKIETPVVKHYGGGSGLLYAEIFEALR